MVETIDSIPGQDIEQQIRAECEADIVIGIPTCNNARTISLVLTAVQAGLTRYFPDLKAVIVNADTGSTDGTLATLRNSVVRKIPVYIDRVRESAVLTAPDPYHPLPGRAAAVSSIFRTAEALDVRACAVLDPDIKNISPAWIERLLMPVLTGSADFVSPVYLRRTFESAITNTILYPLTRALYGKRIRQPAGGNFCISGRLGRFYLQSGAFSRNRTDFYGIDMKLVTEAIANGFVIVEACPGPRIHQTSGGRDVPYVLPRIMESAFDLLESGTLGLEGDTRVRAGPGFVGGLQYRA